MYIYTTSNYCYEKRILSSAFLFASGANEYLDHIIGVFAPQKIRIKRAMARDNITREEVLQRMNRQMDEETKMKLCDSIVINDEQKLVIPQILALHNQFLSRKR